MNKTEFSAKDLFLLIQACEAEIKRYEKIRIDVVSQWPETNGKTLALEGSKKLITAYKDLCRRISGDDEYTERYTENLINWYNKNDR
jgi:hypothetical protein